MLYRAMEDIINYNDEDSSLLLPNLNSTQSYVFMDEEENQLNQSGLSFSNVVGLTLNSSIGSDFI